MRQVPFYFLALVVFVLVTLLLLNSIRLKRNATTFEFTIGTVIRGDEWTGELTYKKAAAINSLKSFVRVADSKRVVIFVDSEYQCKTRPDFMRGCQCQSTRACIDPVYEVPTMECILDYLFQISTTDIVAFINGDILVFNSFAKAIASSARVDHEFLMTGRRHRGEDFVADLDDLSSWLNAESHTKSLALDHGYAIDYFVTRKQTYISALRGVLPPFVIGAWRWDNILMFCFYKFTDVTVIDATFVAPVMHQFQPGKAIEHRQRRGSQFNDELAKRISGQELMFGSIDFADVVLEDSHDGQVGIRNPWHVLARTALKAGVLSPNEIARLKESNDETLATLNKGILSTEEHLSILTEFRESNLGILQAKHHT